MGAGVEGYLANDVSGFVEGRYSDYGTANYTFTETSGGASSTFQQGIGLTESSVPAGLSYHSN